MYHHYTFTTEQLGETEWAMPLLAQTLADWGFESFQEEPDKGLLHINTFYCFRFAYQKADLRTCMNKEL